MPLRRKVDPGPLSRTILDGAVWRQQNAYPASQAWADELERLLAFLVAQDQFERFLPRLRGKESQLEGALAEVRFAYFLHCNDFQILEWEPIAVEGRPGDLSVSWRGGEAIFIEVKGPGWEGELDVDERMGNRRSQGKHIDGEARSLDPIGPALRALEKSLPKLSGARANVVAVVDDLFISPTVLPGGWLERQVRAHLARLQANAVSGVFFLRPELYVGEPIEYFYRFVDNPQASTRLPDDVLQGWLAGNANRQGPRWAPQ